LRPAARRYFSFEKGNFGFLHGGGHRNYGKFCKLKKTQENKRKHKKMQDNKVYFKFTRLA
ncbi:MAG: hypothetical protein IKN26_07975, partial [Eubacterium sp.]|nr:hypothetical protein [Eubacterium sp.]